MSVELWGTFSVRDHLEPRAFVADVLLYDRIVIPTLPDGADPNSWPNEWGLARQRDLLGELGEFAVPIPWSEDRRRRWQMRFDATSASERAAAKGEAAAWVQHDAAYASTRALLCDMANRKVDDAMVRRLTALRKARPGSTLETMAAYPSYAQFERDVPVSQGRPFRATVSKSPTQIFGWEFFVPENEAIDQKTDLALLRKAIDLAKTAEFIELRGLFYGWWHDVLDADLSDVEARADMERRYADYRKIMQKQSWKTGGRFAIKVANVLTAGLAEVACQAVATTAGTMLGSAEILGEKMLADESITPRLKAAAMFHDARRRLGWQAQ